MKKLTRLLLALAMAGALLCGAAMAAEDGSITVQLDGQALTFADAQPQMKDSRTFLPFRALFEELGAEVLYDQETCMVTAIRGDRTITMTLGSNELTITEGEKSSTVTMDVVPYVDVETWRTYVPVRFAAQALDCVVDWEQETYTVTIVDTEKLVAGALEGKSFTWLEKLAARIGKYNEGIWNGDMTMEGSLSMLGASMPMAYTVNSTVADQTKLDMTMNMTMDLRQVLLLAQQLGAGLEMTEQVRTMLDAMATDGVRMAMRGDLAAGTFCMNLSGKLFEEALTEEQKAQLNGTSFEDLWFSVDMGALMAQSDMDMNWRQYMDLVASQAQKADPTQEIKDLLSDMALESAELAGHGHSYEDFKASVEALALAFSDEGLVQEGDTYTMAMNWSGSGNEAQMKIILTMKEDQVTAYAVEMSVSTAASEDGLTPAMTMLMTLGVDEDDRIAGKMALDMAPMATVSFDIAGGYKQGSEAPQTQPPEGAVVLDLSDPEVSNALMGVMPLGDAA